MAIRLTHEEGKVESSVAGRLGALACHCPLAYLGYYSHRGTMLWTDNNVVVAPHTSAGQRSYQLVANLSLDGGRTFWDPQKQMIAYWDESLGKYTRDHPEPYRSDLQSPARTASL